jgi:hypothetical protein
MTWETVEQFPSRGDAAGEVTRIKLSLLRSQTVLWVTFPLAFLRKAGLDVFERLGLQFGTGENADWLRVTRTRQGKNLRVLGGSKTLVLVCFNAPSAWQGFTCESTIIKPGIDITTGAILLPVPWVFPEIFVQQEMAA